MIVERPCAAGGGEGKRHTGRDYLLNTILIAAYTKKQLESRAPRERAIYSVERRRDQKRWVKQRYALASTGSPPSYITLM